MLFASGYFVKFLAARFSLFFSFWFRRRTWENQHWASTQVGLCHVFIVLIGLDSSGHGQLTSGWLGQVSLLAESVGIIGFLEQLNLQTFFKTMSSQSPAFGLLMHLSLVTWLTTSRGQYHFGWLPRHFAGCSYAALTSLVRARGKLFFDHSD